MVFTQFYSAAPVCSPSRAALMTSRYQVRSGIYPRVLFPNSIGGLPHNETTLAELVKSVGYNTAHLGKWHLGVGENRQYLPTTQGFDYYLGVPYSTDMCPCVTCFYPDVQCAPPGSEESCNAKMVGCPLVENDTILHQPADLLTLTEKYVQAAKSIIKTNADQSQPFFLYFAFQHTHQPQFASEKFTNSTLRGPFGDSLANLDWAVGEVMSTLKLYGLDNNTFVFFTSDNGPAQIHERRGGNAGLLRCGKGTTWEGGMREPAIARWPGKIKPGKTTELAATIDLFPTIARLAGAVVPNNVTIDGIDMSPFLFGNGTSDRDYYVYYSTEPVSEMGPAAVRWTHYKAHFHSKGGLSPDVYPDEVCRANYPLHYYDPPLLYDLNQDPGELYNLKLDEYVQVMENIEKIRDYFKSTVVFGVSQVASGVSDNAELCAKPGCSPFPSCCTTNSPSSHWDTFYKPHP
jgi:arylsulfatase A